MAGNSREREVWRHFPTELRQSLRIIDDDRPKDEPLLSPDTRPTLSTDPCLTSLAQLCVWRMKADHGYISLLDDKHHFMLAEAAPSSALIDRQDANDSSDGLFFGGLRASRNRFISGLLLDPATLDPNGALVIDDLTKNERSAHSALVRRTPPWLSFTAVPLRSKRGIIIGSLSVINHRRYTDADRPTAMEIGVMHDIATIIVQHLDIKCTKESSIRVEAMTRGLAQFAAYPKLTPSQAHRTTSIKRKMKETNKQSKTTDFLETILPQNALQMFNRAAESIQTTGKLDGVVFFDASLAALNLPRASQEIMPDRVPLPFEADTADSYASMKQSYPDDDASTPALERREETTDPSSDSSKTDEDKRQTCRVLGLSHIDGDHPDSQRFLDFPESCLRRLLRRYPQGTIKSLPVNPDPLTDYVDPFATQAGDIPSTTNSTDSEAGPAARGKQRIWSPCFRSLFRLCAGATSFSFLPLWDHQRQRFFACMICWTTRRDRILTKRFDLPFFKACGNSIMAGLESLDAETSAASKSTFVSSISHELRTPLHGIIGSADALSDTDLDTFQKNMVHSIRTSGKTLLNVINHIMDYSKMNQYFDTRPRSIVELKDVGHVSIRAPRRQSIDMPFVNDETTAFDLAAALEETIDALYSSHCYSDQSHERKSLRIILDIQKQPNRHFLLANGVWRRAVLNLVGNALKFTQSGFIHVSLSIKKGISGLEPNESQVTLAVKDSGKGMASDFVANKLFVAFSQEDKNTLGIGLGVHIVRMMIESLGGRLEVRSRKDEGTEFIVKLNLAAAEKPDYHDLPRLHSDDAQRLAGKTIAIIDPSPSTLKEIPFLEDEPGPRRADHAEAVRDSLRHILDEWLDMRVIETEAWPATGLDFVIYTEASFSRVEEVIESAWRLQDTPIVTFIAMDTLEAFVLRQDARMNADNLVTCTIVQPLGPHKLGELLLQGLDLKEKALKASRPPPSPRMKGQDITSNRMLLKLPERLRPPMHHRNISTASIGSIPSTPRTETPPPEIGEAPGKKVLVTDDNAINRRLLATFLKKHNYNFVEACHGQAAVEKYTENPASFDIVLMDLSMPVMDGMEATRRIRETERRTDTPRSMIIALTGLTADATRVEAQNSGFDHYLTKPIDFRSLLNWMRQDDTPKTSPPSDASGAADKDKGTTRPMSR